MANPSPSKDQIVAVMRQYRVQSHYRATSAKGYTCYAVFGPDGQITEPARHGEANDARDYLIASDILDLFETEAA